MPKTTYKIRIRKVRDVMIVDYLEPRGRSGWSVLESRNVGPVTMREALESLATLDLSSTPRLAAAVIPTVT